MGEFIEERLSQCVQLGAESEDRYSVLVTNTAGGSRYASLRHPKPYREFDIGFVMDDEQLASEVESLYHRTYGGYAGFRVKAWKDFTTALDGMSAYSATDCVLTRLAEGQYQLVKEYGRDKPGLASIGRPRRSLFKPIAGKVSVAVAGVAHPTAQWSVNTANGVVSFAANKSRNITGITKAGAAVIEVGTNTFLVGESVVVSQVVGMTQINGKRALITAKPDTTHITVAINSTAFSDYANGGVVQTLPLDAGTDIVTGGCEFDIPVAFDSTLNSSALGNGVFDASGLRLVELLNP